MMLGFLWDWSLVKKPGSLQNVNLFCEKALQQAPQEPTQGIPPTIVLGRSRKMKFGGSRKMKIANPPKTNLADPVKCIYGAP